MQEDCNVTPHRRRSIRQLPSLPFVSLTCNFQRGVPAPGDADLVGGLAPIDAAVLLLLVLHHAQEEQRSGGKQDAVGVRRRGRRLNGLAIAEPRNLKKRK